MHEPRPIAAVPAAPGGSATTTGTDAGRRSARGRRLGVTATIVVAVGLATSPAMAQVDPEPTSTMAPTTVAPTTAPPTTAAPTTQAPVTTVATTVPTTAYVPPTTVAPVTQAPTTARTPSTTASAATSSSTASSTTSTSEASTTTSSVPLLVDGSETVDTEPVSDSGGIDSGTKLSLIVAGLLAIAVVLSILTVLYWRKTRPYEWEEWDDDEDGDSPPTSPGPSTAAAATAASGGAASGPSPTTSTAATDGGASSATAAPSDGRRPEPAPAAVTPAVPSLIDPELRDRVLGTTGAPAGSVTDDTQAMPVVVAPVGGDAAPADAPARWGTAAATGGSDPGPATPSTDA